MYNYAWFKKVKVRYSDKGKGRVIVLLHGSMESLEIWDTYSDVLARKYRVIAVDLPGHGKTPAIGYIHTMDTMAHCVKAVLDTLKIKRYILVGHSMGGYAALAFADLYNDNVAGLCLFHSTALPDSPQKKKDRERAVALVKQNPKQYIYSSVTRQFAPFNIPLFKAEINQLKTIAQKMSARSIVNTLEGMKIRPKRDWLLQMAEFPVMYIIGKQDAVYPYQAIVQQATNFTSHVLLIDNCGHNGFIEARQITQTALLKFATTCFKKTSDKRALAGK